MGLHLPSPPSPRPVPIMRKTTGPKLSNKMTSFSKDTNAIFAKIQKKMNPVKQIFGKRIFQADDANKQYFHKRKTIFTHIRRIGPEGRVYRCELHREKE